MSKRRKLHAKGAELATKLEAVIDQIKELGPRPLDGRFPSTMR